MPDGEGLESSFASRTAVLADAQGLLTCYGVGEDGSANLPHAVVELCFTSSVRFLQPGLLLKARSSIFTQKFAIYPSRIMPSMHHPLCHSI